MATKYVSTLTGAQMDKALTDMNNHISEAWAVGERNGTPVTSGDETYNNNAKYYASQAGTAISAAQAAATQAGASASAAATSATNSANSATAAAGSASAASASATTAANQAVRAKDEANRAEAIVGGQFVTYGAPQSLTEEQKQQARENIGVGSGSGGGRNLLDNGWFTINQRGQSSYSSGYTLDRWLIGGGSYTVTKLSGYGINISKPANNSLLYMQTFESARLEVGKTYTLSINVDGVVYSRSFVYDGGSAQSYHNYVDFNGGGFRYRLLQSGTNADLLEFRINDATTSALNVNIYSVMIEPGSASTLANATPPDYATELQKCQYYFASLNPEGNAYATLGIGYCRQNTKATVTTPLPRTMRSWPTITFIKGSMADVVLRIGSSTKAPTNLVVDTFSGNFMGFEFITSGLTVGALCDIYTKDGAIIGFSADL